MSDGFKHDNTADTQRGAERLAETIRSYWAARGKTVELRLEPVYIGAKSRGNLTAVCIRSDMVNGLPA